MKSGGCTFTIKADASLRLSEEVHDVGASVLGGLDRVTGMTPGTYVANLTIVNQGADRQVVISFVMSLGEGASS